MTTTVSDSPAIAGVADLARYLADGCKPKSAWRIGTEHEKFVFCRNSLKPLPYDGPKSIRALLEALIPEGWTPVFEGGNPIALTHADGSSITLEPGGQLELSGAPLETIHDTCVETSAHLNKLKAIAEPLGIGMIGLGFHPKWPREAFPWMPKGRYAIMRRYMPTRGTRGLDMMLRTCTVQVNLDFASEADMIKKFRIALALQPVATALFANSPFVEGKPNGFKSYRADVWTDTDPDRTGTPEFVFESGMGFERYVDYMLDVPMYFVHRGDRYVDASGQSFRDFMAGKLPALPGERPTLADWADHITTAFPEVRLKRYLEMRGADGSRWCHLCALPALWVGLLYDDAALDAAWDLAKAWTPADRFALAAVARRDGLAANFKCRPLQDLAREVLAIAREGLARRARRNDAGEDETKFLDVLEEIVATGHTQADELLDLYHGAWNGSVDPAFEAFSY
ncbi:Glutamate--cysteine ligase, chloroplastic [uncultured Alphaproteobacteria bacterium]|uniref:Glutamate--cysteine ligase n=1 Tax=uncultured Alphaproteobacteria bacterium TaxID=91750 RepID=A0A212K725_9PROT|nr:Glutamate--cysteine ligase, chloroplastic [uncultured Alphaproteobacteria bacterium]